MSPSKDDQLGVDLVRGVCGGCLVALPLLLTMESWWLGHDLGTGRVLSYVVVTLIALYGLNALSGYREAHGLWLDLGDAVISLAIGVLVSAVMLVALAEIRPDSSPLVALRQVLLLALPLSVGVSLSRSQLGSEDEEEDTRQPGLAWRLGVSAAGALMLGMTAAPTEEIELVAIRASWAHLLGITALSLALAWATLYVAGFVNQGSRLRHPSRPGEVLAIHGLGLVVSGLLLGGFAYFEGETSLAEALAAVVVLGLLTTTGAAAGRLVL